MSEREYNRFLGVLRLVALFAVILVVGNISMPLAILLGFVGLPAGG